MSIPGTELLRLLAGAGSALLRPGSAAAPAGAADGLDFSSLLQKAKAGEIASGREVTIASKAGLSLTPDQLQRLSVAADRAEAQGATRALVLLDGMALKLDVTTRQITGAADLSAGGVLTDIDAVVGLPSDPATTGAASQQVPSILPLPRPGALANPSLLKLLSAARAAG